MSIEPLGTNFSEMLIKILTFSFKKMRLKISSAKLRPCCPGADKLTHCGATTPYGIVCIGSYHASWSTLAQVKACRLFGTKPLSEFMLAYCHMGLCERIAVKFESRNIYFLRRKCIQNIVYRLSTILSRPQCVNFQFMPPNGENLEAHRRHSAS